MLKQLRFVFNGWRLLVPAGIFAMLLTMAPLGSANAASSELSANVTVSVLTRDHFEGDQYTYSIGYFTDNGACTTVTPITCRTPANYQVNVHWGDGQQAVCGNSVSNPCGSTSNPVVTLNASKSSGTSEWFDVSATHTYADEFNCPVGQTCSGPNQGYPISMNVTDNVDSVSVGSGTGAGVIAIMDQTLDNGSTGTPISATEGFAWSGRIGTFHDDNAMASTNDTGGSPEYSVKINWGDNSGTDTSGTVAVNQSSCGSSSGSGSGQGCTVDVTGTHTYWQAGTYTISATVQDGLDSHYQAVLTATATVVAPASLGGNILYGPGATISGSTEAAFAVGTNHSVWWRSSTDGGNSWTAWGNLGGTTYAAPTAVSPSAGTIDLFVKGTDNAVWQDVYSSGAWHGWSRVGGRIEYAPAATSSAAGRVDLVAVGTNNGLWYTFSTGGAFGSWQGVGGRINASPGITSSAGNHLDVVVRGTNNGAWYTAASTSSSGATWGGWSNEGGAVIGGFALTSPATGHVDVYGVGTNDSIWRKELNSGTWSGWANQGGSTTQDLAAVSPSSTSDHVFYRAANGQLDLLILHD